MSDQEVYLIAHKEVEYSPYRSVTTGLEYPADFHKIGIATNPETRMSIMSSGTPHELELITTIETNDAKEVEKTLHQFFSMAHHRGEWYKLTQGDVNSLEAIDRIETEVFKEYVSEKAGPVYDSSLYVELMQWREQYE